MKTTNLRTPICLLSLVLSLVPTAAHGGGCGTNVPAGLVVNQTWTPAGSPYCVQGTIQVSQLTIQSGVEVRLASDARIEVLSTITAVGTEAQPIVFTASALANPWRGMHFQKTPAGSQLVHCLVRDSEDGALTVLNGQAPIMQHCVFYNNTRAGHGGAINASGLTAPLSVEDCTFLNNVANPGNISGNYVGGAIYVANTTAVISRSRFVGNRVNSLCPSNFCDVMARGGATYVTGGNDVRFDTCIFDANIANASHPAFCSVGSDTIVRGGAIEVAGGNVLFHNCLITCNVLSGSNCGLSRQGSGIYVAGGTVALMNSTIVRNGAGPALERAGGSLSVKNSIVFFNNSGGAQIAGTVTADYCDIQGGFPSGTNIININPVFAGDNCACPDYRVVPGSPCIDGGDIDVAQNDSCLGPGLVGVRNDMGAYGGPMNCAWPCWVPADANCDATVNIDDLLTVINAWGPCAALPEDCPADIVCSGSVDIDDLLAVINNWD